jgi:biopolymer transport protein ExbB/TolQ
MPAVSWSRNCTCPPEQIRINGVHLEVNQPLALAQLAAELAAASVHRKMARGLAGLATIAATAPFLGMLGTVWGIYNSFTGFDGERSAIMAALADRLSQAIMPTALGLAVATMSLWGYRYLNSWMGEFDVEMRNAILELPGHLSTVLTPVRPRKPRQNESLPSSGG